MKRKNIGRILLVLAMFGLLVGVGLIESVEFALFAVGIFLGLIPPIALLVLTAVIAGLVLKVFRHSNLVLITFLGLLISQAVVLFSWFEGWTATSAFREHAPEAGLSVIDPQLEHQIMIAFWLIAAFLLALATEHLVNSFLSSELNLSNKSSSKAQVGVLLFEAFLLLSLNSSVVNFMRLTRNVNVPASASSDGTKEIQLVPINAWIDTNGIVIARKTNSLVWKTVGEVGDSLTEADGGRFVWSRDCTKVYLLLNFHQKKDFPMLGFNFESNRQIDPKTFVAPE
jgi:hypothetical protein